MNSTTLKVDHSYTGTVAAACWKTARTGSLGLELKLECEDGIAEHTVWLTEKNHERASHELEILGTTVEELMQDDRPFLRNVLGTQIDFRTAEETFNGKPRTKVANIFRHLDPAQIKEKLKAFAKNGETTVVISDSDIPF